MTRTAALLALEDGSLFRGISIGAAGETVGEVVFNTAMTGYQEILTDPSYARQIVTLTHPHIGNTGCNAADVESRRPFAAGLLIRDLPLLASNWRSEELLDRYLQRHGVVAMAELDTRRLTRLLRDKGAQNGCIVTGDEPDPEQALSQARAFPGLKGMDLAKEVSVQAPYEWSEGGFDLDANGFVEGSSPNRPLARAPTGISIGAPARARFQYPARAAATDAAFHVVAYDYGIKRNILRMLVDQGCRVTVVPATMPAIETLELHPDGILLGNGPGDPDPCDYAIAAIREFIAANIPIFGICLGHQLLALAAGARTVKMKFGHHGANHPVLELDTGRVMISSQNHGFAVDEDTLPDTVRTTHRSLFDGSLQGIELTDAPAFSFQGHPEASPGPHDVQPLFHQFVEMMRETGLGTRDSGLGAAT